MTGSLRQVIVPVHDLDAAVRHYSDHLGLQLRFRDGERWAAFSAAELTVALAGPSERPAATKEVALGIRVPDLQAAIDAVHAAGGDLVSGPLVSEHEHRATCRDQFGTLVTLYTPHRMS